MSTFIRGPICGVGNCPSRLWRIIDGRRTCQYGHVMEGDVEFNNDEDDIANAGVITKRLNLTTSATGNFQSSYNASQSLNSQTSNGGKKIYGHEAKLLFLKAFQFILRNQAIWMIRELNLPSEFEQVVKLIWISYLKWIDEVEGRASQEEVNSSEDEERELHDNRNDSCNLQLNMVAAVSILYMASVHMGLPIYTMDFVKWIATVKIPYFKANRILPELWKEQLPNYYLRLLGGGKPPHDGQVFVKVAQICSRVKFATSFNNTVRYEGLVLKLIMLATLPPEFYFFTVNLIKTQGDEDNFKLTENEKPILNKPYLWPELRVTAYFILATRWILMCDEETYTVQWILSLSKRPQRTDTSQDSMNHLLAKISSGKESVNVFDWSKEETSEYLRWFEDSFLRAQDKESKMKIDHKIAKRKLYKIFPINSDSFKNETTQKDQSSFIEQLQEKYLYFLSDVESHWNEESAPCERERMHAIAGFEKILTDEITLKFAISSGQLRTVIQYIEKKCLKQ